MKSIATGIVTIALVLSVCLLGYTITSSMAEDSPAPGMVHIDNGVVIRQGDNVNYSFAEDTNVDRLLVCSEYIEVNTLRIQTTPSSGYAHNTIYILDPDVRNTGNNVLRLVTSETDSNATVTYRLTGLLTFYRYTWYRDGVKQTTMDSSGEGSIAFSCCGPWSTHEIVVQVTSTSSPTGIQASYIYTNAGMTYYFTDTSFGDVTKWLWNFGDGFGSSTPDPSHKFKEIGSYRVSLTVYSATGDSSVAVTTVNVGLGPDNVVAPVDDGWSLYISDDLVLHAPALGLLFTGSVMIILGKWGPEMPILTRKGRVFFGLLGIACAAYWFLFSEWAVI